MNVYHNLSEVKRIKSTYLREQLGISQYQRGYLGVHY